MVRQIRSLGSQIEFLTEHRAAFHRIVCEYLAGDGQGDSSRRPDDTSSDENREPWGSMCGPVSFLWCGTIRLTTSKMSKRSYAGPVYSKHPHTCGAEPVGQVPDRGGMHVIKGGAPGESRARETASVVRLHGESGLMTVPELSVEGRRLVAEGRLALLPTQPDKSRVYALLKGRLFAPREAVGGSQPAPPTSGVVAGRALVGALVLI